MYGSYYNKAIYLNKLLSAQVEKKKAELRKEADGECRGKTET